MAPLVGLKVPSQVGEYGTVGLETLKEPVPFRLRPPSMITLPLVTFTTLPEPSLSPPPPLQSNHQLPETVVVPLGLHECVSDHCCHVPAVLRGAVPAVVPTRLLRMSMYGGTTDAVTVGQLLMGTPGNELRAVGW